MELTENEKDLIEMIRSYRKTYPPSEQIEYVIQRLLEELLEEDSSEKEEEN